MEEKPPGCLEQSGLERAWEARGPVCMEVLTGPLAFILEWEAIDGLSFVALSLYLVTFRY